MRILLVGEFSALHKNLKTGLIKLGHDVTIIADGDGWKKVDCDINLGSNYGGFIGKIERRMKDLINLKNMKGYDAVHIINPNFFKHRKFGKLMMKVISENNKKIFLSAAGDDCQVIRYGLNQGYKYWTYSDCELPSKNYYQSESELEVNRLVMQMIDGVIPVMYEYAEAYRNSKYSTIVKNTIPLAVDCERIDYFENKVEDKVVIFHGLNREEVKGTKYILEALEKLKDTHGDQVEVIVDGKMPLKKYLEIMKRANIVIDQCKSYSYGMNALYALAQGKVVLSGAEPEGLTELQVEKTPIVNITPDSDMIYRELVKLLDKELLKDKGVEGRKYVERFHDSKKVAEQYLECFKGEK